MQYKVGDKVRTLTQAGAQDWCSYRSYAKWGITGEVVDVSDAHGVCYKVMHDDSNRSQCWYNPEELAAQGPATELVKLELTKEELRDVVQALDNACEIYWGTDRENRARDLFHKVSTVRDNILFKEKSQ